MLQRRGSVVGVDDMTRLVMKMGNPFSKLSSIRDCGREEHLEVVFRSMKLMNC